MIAVQAELTQTPFYMPIAESELVSGYMTEYSGFRFLIFFIAEFATAGVFSLIASVLFLGSWGVPFRWCLSRGIKWAIPAEGAATIELGFYARSVKGFDKVHQAPAADQ